MNWLETLDKMYPDSSIYGIVGSMILGFVFVYFIVYVLGN